MNAADILSAILPARPSGASKDANVPTIPGLPEDLVSSEGDPDFAEFVEEAFETILPEETETPELNADVTSKDVIMPRKAPASIIAPILELSTKAEQVEIPNDAVAREVVQIPPEVATQVVAQMSSDVVAQVNAPLARTFFPKKMVDAAVPQVARTNFVQADEAPKTATLRPIVNAVAEKTDAVMVPDVKHEPAGEKPKDDILARAATRTDKPDVTADVRVPRSFAKQSSTPTIAPKIASPEPQLIDQSIEMDKSAASDLKSLLQEMPTMSRMTNVTSGTSSVFAASTAPVPIPKRVLGQISSAIAKVSDGRVEIRLDPPELGRVVMVITQNDAGVTAHLAAENSDIVDFLKRNAETFARELARAGFEGASLEFSKRDQQQEGTDMETADEYAITEADSTSAEGELPTIQIQTDGLDIRL